MSTEKVVTHEDRRDLTEIRERVVKNSIGCDYTLLHLLDRLIKAAEADPPPLPEGWVVLHGDGSHGATQRPFWHKDGTLYAVRHDDGLALSSATVDSPYAARDRLTPLRPTVSAKDVDRAQLAWARCVGGLGDSMRAAFEAAGVEVTS